MIDSNGNKITEAESAVDIEFKLDELNFLTKGFWLNPTPEKAMSIAEEIKQISDGYQDLSLELIEKISAIEKELERYVPDSEDESFVWELVYVLRNLARKTKGDKGFSDEAAAIIHRSALLFDKICEIVPSVHNYICRVGEYRLESSYCTKYSKTKEVLDIAEELFEQIEPNKEPVYLRNAGVLYVAFYEYYKGVRNNMCAFVAVKEAVGYVYELNKTKPSYENLNRLIIYYLPYAKQDDYVYADEAERLDEIIGLTQAWYSDTDDTNAKEQLEKLEALRSDLKNKN